MHKSEIEALRRLDMQADRIAELIEVPPETVMTWPTAGVLLSPEQADKLLRRLLDVG